MNDLQLANPVADAIDSLGGDTAVAALAGLKTSWAVSKWRKRLPPERVLWLAQQTGWKFSPHLLAPNLYPNPTDGLPKSKRAGHAKPIAQAVEFNRRHDDQTEPTHGAH